MAGREYQDRLARLRGEIGAMADLVLDRYEMAISALDSGDTQLAQQVIDGDSELNDWYLDIEAECLGLLREEEPLAGDLRCIASSFKIATDLERVGDLSTNLAAYGRDADGQLAETVSLESLVVTAGEMVSESMAAYTKQDPKLARTVVDRDDGLDRECRQASEQVVRALVTAGQEEVTRHDPASADLGWGNSVDRQVERVTRGLLTIRDLERIGDHAVNISARTVYMLENDPALIY